MASYDTGPVSAGVETYPTRPSSTGSLQQAPEQTGRAVPKVDVYHRDYEKYKLQWERCRDCREGSDAVKAKGSRYLPALDSQVGVGTSGYTAYNQYRDRALFYNATGRTIDGLTGLVFQTEAMFDASEEVIDAAEDITLTGVPLDLFSQDLTKEVMTTGRAGVLVDITDGDPSEARPYWTQYRAEDICMWRVEKVGSDPAELTLVILKETSEMVDPRSPYETKCADVRRVLTLQKGVYTTQTFTKDPDSSQWTAASATQPERRGKTLDFIPFQFVGSLKNTPAVDKSPVLDLVDVNLSHYRTSADLEYGLFHVGVPTLVLTGVPASQQNEPVKLGPSAAFYLPMGGDAKILQVNGETLGALERADERKRKLMATLGARLLEDQPDTMETATAVSMRHSSDHGSLRSIVNSVEEAVTWALRVSAWWMDGVAELTKFRNIHYTLNKDFFSSKMSVPEFTAWITALQAGKVSFETFWAAFTRGGMASPAISAEDELDRISKQAESAMPNQEQLPPGTPGVSNQPREEQVAAEGNPYEVKQVGGSWVVTKLDSDTPVSGGNHGKDKAKAMAHFRALEAAYRREKDKK